MTTFKPSRLSIFCVGLLLGCMLDVIYVAYQLSHAAGRSMTLDEALPIIEEYHEQRRETELTSDKM